MSLGKHLRRKISKSETAEAFEGFDSLIKLIDYYTFHAQEMRRKANVSSDYEDDAQLFERANAALQACVAPIQECIEYLDA